MKFSPDSRLIASCGDDHTIKLWDVTKKKLIHTFIDHLDGVNTVKFSPDGTCISSGSVDKKIKIFDIRSKRLIQHYDAHSASVMSLCYHPNGKYLISSSMDSTIKIWDVVNGQILYTVHGHEGPVCSVDFSRDGDYFCSGGTDQVLIIWKSNVAGEGFPKGEKKKKKNVKNYTSSGNLKKNNYQTNNNNNSNNNVNVNVNNVNDGNYNYSGGMSNLGNTGNYGYSGSGNNFIGSQTGFQSMNIMVRTNQFESSSSSNLNKVPEELKITFEKLISQMDMVGKTMQIMDQRLLKLENQVGILYNRQRKGFIEPGLIMKI